MPADSAAGKAEAALKRAAAKKGMKGRRAARYVYGAMNNAGLMHGNKVTARGAKTVMPIHRPARVTLMR